MDQAWLKFLPGSIRTRIEGRHNLQKAMTNMGWLFVDKIVRMGVGLIVVAWVARYLGPEQFGIYNFAIAFVALFAPLATLGLDGIVIRNILRDPVHQEETLGTAFALKLIGALLTLLLTVGSISLLKPGDGLTRSLVAITAAGMVFQAFDTIDFWFQSQVQSRYTVYARNTAFLLVSLVKVALILMRESLVAFAWAGLAEIVLGAIGLVVAYHINKNRLTSWKIRIAQARLLIADSWPLILAGLSIMIYMKIDQVMLGQMAGRKAVGIYSAATKISEIWYFIPTAIVSSVFPSVVRAKSESESLYYMHLQRLFGFMSMLSLMIAVPMTFLSSWIVSMLFGAAFSDAGPVLTVHIWACLFVFLGVAQSSWDLAENLTRLSLFRTVTGAVLNIVLNLFLIPRYTAMGAAVATVISYAFSAYVLNAAHPRTMPIFLRQTKSIFFPLYVRTVR